MAQGPALSSELSRAEMIRARPFKLRWAATVRKVKDIFLLGLAFGDVGLDDAFGVTVEDKPCRAGTARPGCKAEPPLPCCG